MGNIKVKINEIDESISLLVETELKNRKLPVCLGFQTPPLLYNEIDMEETEIVKVNFEVEEENTYATKKLNSILNSPIYHEDHKFAILKSGVLKAKELKQKMIIEYVDHIEKCSTCKFIDICNKLTSHYRETISSK